jgi:hypothetical protein
MMLSFFKAPSILSDSIQQKAMLEFAYCDISSMSSVIMANLVSAIEQFVSFL